MIQFRWPWRRAAQIGNEVDEELRFHLDMRTDALIREGAAPDAARAQALAEFGNVEQARRDLGRTDRGTEDHRRRRMLAEEWGRDLVLATRSLRRAPGFAALAVAILGLGIGLATVVFSVVNGVLFRPLPYAEPDRLVTLWQLDTRKGERDKPAIGNFLDWRQRSRSFEQLAAAVPYGFDLKETGRPAGISAFQITSGFFELLGLRPVAGRFFAPEEYEVGGAPVIVLSERLWRKRYGADPSVVGRMLPVDEGARLVVGIAPEQLDYPSRADVYVPRLISGEDRQQRVQTYINVIGRLRPAVGLEQVRDEMRRIGADLEREYPVVNARVTVPVLPLLEHLTGSVRDALLALLGAVGLVLLMTCVNVANLLLARGMARRPEIAVRAALGAGRGRIARQLVVESGVLAAAGGIAGTALSALVLPAVVHAATAVNLPRIDAIVLDGRVLGAALVSTLITVILAGLLPAWTLSRRTDGLLVRGGRETGAGGTRRTGRMLVAAEVAIALMLLVGAGLLGQSLRRVLSEDLGYATDHRLLLTTHFWDRYPTPAERAVFLVQVEDRLRGLPGVLAVGSGSALPLSLEGSEMDPPFGVEGRAFAQGEEPTARVTFVTPGYFDAMHIPLLRGRLLSADDRADGRPVAVISETMARRIWPADDPLGKRIVTRSRGVVVTREVVGIVGDVRNTGHEEVVKPGYYVPHAQNGFGSMTIVLHTQGNPAALIEAAQQQVWALQNDLSFAGTEVLDALLAGTLAVRRVILLTIGCFALLGAVLAALGIYGVISLAVTQRTRELGVRMALGAAPASLRRMVLRQGMGLALTGMVAGGAGAFLLSRLIRTLLYGTRPTDLGSFVLSVGVLAGAALLAAWIPARRATRVDPLVALRSD